MQFYSIFLGKVLMFNKLLGYYVLYFDLFEKSVNQFQYKTICYGKSRLLCPKMLE